jgi:hypothetical protein
MHKKERTLLLTVLSRLNGIFNLSAFSNTNKIRKDFFHLRKEADSIRNVVPILECCKGKVIPLQAWTGPEGSRRLRLPDFMTIGT